MRRMRTWAIVFALSVVAAAGDKAPALKRHASADKKYSIELPAAWDVTVEKADKEVLRLDVDIPDKGRAVIQVFAAPGMVTPLVRAYRDRDWRLRQENGRKYEVVLEPFPQLLEKQDEQVWAHAYRVVKRLGFSITIGTRQFEAIKAEWQAAVRSFRADIEEWPGRPKDFKAVKKSGFVFLLQPGVKAAAIREMGKILKQRIKAVSKVYGKFKIDAANAPQILVFKAKEFSPKPITQNYALDRSERRIYGVPVLKDEMQRKLDFAQLSTMLIVDQALGGLAPMWISQGEGMIAWSEQHSGERLPMFHPTLYKELPSDLMDFSELSRPMQKYPENFRHQAVEYLMLFRVGPGEYKKAWKGFVKDLASGDFEAARRKHLGGLDAAAVMAAAKDVVALKIKQTK